VAERYLLIEWGIDAHLAGVSSITPVKVAFGSTSVLLIKIKVGSFQPMVVDCWLMYAGLDE